MDKKRAVTLLLLALVACPTPFAESAGAARFGGAEKRLMLRLSSDELHAYFGMRYLLSPAARIEYLSIPGRRARRAWLERFWIEHDPTPATDSNEARVEHERRVELARELFGMREAPGWDGRGEMLIRFGMPSLRTSIPADVTTTGLRLPGEAWYYETLDMAVTFHDRDLKGHYFYNVPQQPQKIPGPRGGFSQAFTPPEMDYCADPLVSEMLARTFPYQIMEMEGKKAGRAAERFSEYMEKFEAIHSCDLIEGRLSLYLDVGVFRSDAGGLAVDFCFEVPAHELRIVADGDSGLAEVDFGILVRDTELRRVANGIDASRFSSPDSAAGELVPGRIVLALEPGHYRIGAEARDAHANRRAAITADLELDPCPGAPCLSDIQFASAIREAPGAGKYVKRGIEVVPHATRTYRVPNPIFCYFEIYDLDTDGDGRTFYRVEYRIDPLERRRWGPVLLETRTAISSTFESSGYGATQPQRLSIATENLWEGRFRLTVTVTDRRTFRTATRSEDFSILE